MKISSIVNSTVLHDLQLVESTDVEEPHIQKADYVGFRQLGGSAPLTPVLFKGQLYIFSKYYKY